MPRIRSIKPDFFKSDDVAALPLRARLLWIGLWTQCDDHGRYKDSVRLIKGDLWSLDDVSLRDIEEDLSILEAERRLVRYEVDGKRFLAIVNWHDHQAINRPSNPKYPSPPVPMTTDPDVCIECCKPGQGRLRESSLNAHGVDNSGLDVSAGKPAHARLTDGSLQEGKGKEGKGGDARAGVSVSPPAPRCPRHLDDPEPPNCGACADARRARARWDLADSDRRRAAPNCRLHRGEPADNCGRCRSEALADQEPT